MAPATDNAQSIAAPTPKASSFSRQPIEGSILSSERLPTVEELQDWLLDALHAAENFSQQHPEVDNVEKLCKRIKRDLHFVQKFLRPEAASLTDQHQASEPPAAPSTDHEASTDLQSQQENIGPPQTATTVAANGEEEMSLVRMQGIVNNLRGFRGELQAAQEAPQVVAVCRKFCSLPRNRWKDEPAPGAKRKGSSKQQAKKPVAAAAAAGDADSDEDEEAPEQGQVVEVDVVAHNGLTWIEVKAHESFGPDSVHWLGAPGHVKGLRRQLLEALQVAQAPCNLRRWRAPQLVMHFPSGADALVKREVEAMGIHVADGPGSLTRVPDPTPRLPAVSNLDVTTMCAMVSEISHGGCARADVLAWSARNVHWRECVAAEQRSPVLLELAEYVGAERKLVACSAAVQQFQSLVDMHGGPVEAARWRELKGRMVVHDNLPAAGASSSTAAAEAAEAAPFVPLTARVAKLEKVTVQQRAVFGLGDALQVVTLTANGNAVRCIERQGVNLEVVMHRAVWLAGV